MSLAKSAVLAAAVALSGCWADVGPAGVGVRAESYSPLYYEGNAIYYDDVGEPYYIVEGAPYYVPQSHPYYRTYTNHYRVHRDGYGHWYGRHRPAFHDRYRASRPRYRRR